ncbi:MAG: YkgJ family cysteine cluster protein [Myxococcota bacterium]
MADDAEDDAPVKVPFRIHTARGVLEASVQTTRAPIPVVDVVGAARGLDDALIGLALQQAEAEGAPATCRRGCTACCHHPVPLSPAEAHALAAQIAGMPEARREAVEARFAAVREQVRAAGLLEALEGTLQGGELPVGAYLAARIPCPLLEDGACSIYADRPLACREHLVSSDPPACSEPGSPAVRAVPLLARLARALTRVSAEAWPAAPARIPLLVAPGWARAHAAEAGVRRGGVALLERLLSELR